MEPGRDEIASYPEEESAKMSSEEKQGSGLRISSFRSWSAAACRLESRDCELGVGILAALNHEERGSLFIARPSNRIGIWGRFLSPSPQSPAP